MNKEKPDINELKRLYSLGYSMQEIGEFLNMSAGKIHKYFHIYKIKRRVKLSLNMYALKQKINTIIIIIILEKKFILLNK